MSIGARCACEDAHTNADINAVHQTSKACAAFDYALLSRLMQGLDCHRARGSLGSRDAMPQFNGIRNILN